MVMLKLTILLLTIICLSMMQKTSFASKKSFVVYFGGHSHGVQPSSIDLHGVTESHYEFLGSFLGSKEKAIDAIFYSYKWHINGFAALLEDEEAKEISKHPDVISVFLDNGKKLHTTRSWGFLGLERNDRIPSKSIWRKAKFGEDIIIGNIDTGVWPESESFNDEGMGPVPSRWKGFCQNNTKVGVKCNRKLIGARYFNKGYKGPSNELYSTTRDHIGHGTHTLSTAGGRFVAGANILGFGNGTAKGGSPNARVAAYKVCWPQMNSSSFDCPDANIISAFDAAIHDGVDVISVSMGDYPNDYLTDSVAIGSFHAVKNGIVVVCSAGNKGPMVGSVNNVAPWILTVGATTTDREFLTYVQLGNKMQLKGQSLSPEILPVKKLYPLVCSVDARARNATKHAAKLCHIGSLDPKKVKGKIVVCLWSPIQRLENGKEVADAGGIGMILVNDISTGYETIPDLYVLPTSHISSDDGLTLSSYINSTKNPMAYISPAITKLDAKPAPSIASFSSRGPNSITSEILKPDIVAPGVSIIAASPPASGLSSLAFDSRQVPFNSLSGTSQSCPTVSGIVGLLKALHPDWSPAAIRSALMTTARTQNNMKVSILDSSHIKANPFSYGAGHVRPNSAMDPGLVYDLSIRDYLNFLCAVGYKEYQIAKFAKESYRCPVNPRLINFNYPSITVPSLYDSVTVTRTVKNVGSPSTYNVQVKKPLGISVLVEPRSLQFNRTGEERTFNVTLKWKEGNFIDDYVFGGLVWYDGVHKVRSPIVVGLG
ncbi:subtilisin-like protease SBT5.3 [Macadamia integrifolia]|uniref:subtilisin-like protease SBT5.3 n=1 Tax=Macadamia integrifolia TaxID=60698 RepID=UPI001C532F63|nr:subtilisin-like protease SBT5.3 [Macadamia integrifolia]